jgi:aldose 1-epimerase
MAMSVITDSWAGFLLPPVSGFVYTGTMTSKRSATVTPDSELVLSHARQRAIVSPWGAALRRYFLIEPSGAERDMVWGYAGASHKKGGQGDVLIPFPGRIKEGRYTFDGASYQLERNDKEGPNAIHGFVRNIPWTLLEQQSDRAEFEVAVDAMDYARRGYPFSLNVRVTYQLQSAGLSCGFAVRNAGAHFAPVGVGFHPYFTVGTATIDEAEARIPARGYLEFDERLAPTGRILEAVGEWDYRQFRRIGSRRFNHCYVELDRASDGSCTATLRDPSSGHSIDVVMDRSFSAVVVYTGDAIGDAPRRALAIEAMTCASDAFNHPDWGLKRLGPGETFVGRFAVHASVPDRR